MRILFVSAPLLGHLNPMVPFIQATQDAGHEVRVATGGDALKEHEWLDLGVHEDLMRRSRDATDAVVAALVARAAAVGRGTRPGPEHEVVVKSEGWIVLPIGSLGDLDPGLDPR